MKLYAIRYGEQFIYGTKGTVFQNAENKGEKIQNFAFFYYLAEYGGKYILFDTGFRDEKLAVQMGVTLLSIDEEIKKVFGTMPRIDKVILTHSHWDHVNNLDLYSEADVILSEKTYEHIMQAGEEFVKESLVGAKLTLIDKEAVIDNKFHMCLVGGHTSDSSAIFFEDREKEYVITGDECYQCDNIYKNIPIGICEDGKKNVEFIMGVHKKGIIPLPFHDESILDKYKRVSTNIVQII